MTSAFDSGASRTLALLVVVFATSPVLAQSVPAGCFPRCRTGYVCEAGACVAAPDPVDPSDHAHDGFFLRFEIGPGYTDSRLGDFEASGLGYQIGVAIGAAVVENVIVMVSANELIVRDASTNRDQALEAVFGSNVRVDLGVREATLGAGYYLMPANLFAGAHLGLGFAQINANGIESDMGPSVGLDLAKEFWVGSAWGLGAGLRLVWMKLPLDEQFSDDATRDGVEVWAGRLSFIATFN
jgi:hypothetical protein